MVAGGAHRQAWSLLSLSQVHHAPVLHYGILDDVIYTTMFDDPENTVQYIFPEGYIHR